MLVIAAKDLQLEWKVFVTGVIPGLRHSRVPLMPQLLSNFPEPSEHGLAHHVSDLSKEMMGEMVRVKGAREILLFDRCTDRSTVQLYCAEKLSFPSVIYQRVRFFFLVTV